MKNKLILKINQLYQNEKAKKLIHLFFIRLQVFIVAIAALYLAKGGVMIAQFALADFELINLELIVGGILGIIFAIVFLVIVQKYIDKSPKTIISLLYEKKIIQNSLGGIFFSALIFSLIIFLLYITHHIEITPAFENLNPDTVGIIIERGLFYFILAFTEELIFRGYAIMRLEKFFSPLTVLVVQSLYFTVSATFTYSLFLGGGVGAVNLQYFLFVFMISFFFGLIRMRSGSLWFVIFFHGLWNFYQAGITSIASDGQYQAFFKIVFLKHTFLSDVSGNIEGGLIGFSVILIAALILFYPIRKQLIKGFFE